MALTKKDIQTLSDMGFPHPSLEQQALFTHLKSLGYSQPKIQEALTRSAAEKDIIKNFSSYPESYFTRTRDQSDLSVAPFINQLESMHSSLKKLESLPPITQEQSEKEAEKQLKKEEQDRIKVLKQFGKYNPAVDASLKDLSDDAKHKLGHLYAQAQPYAGLEIPEYEDVPLPLKGYADISRPPSSLAMSEMTDQDLEGYDDASSDDGSEAPSETTVRRGARSASSSPIPYPYEGFHRRQNLGRIAKIPSYKVNFKKPVEKADARALISMHGRFKELGITQNEIDGIEPVTNLERQKLIEQGGLLAKKVGLEPKYLGADAPSVKFKNLKGPDPARGGEIGYEELHPEEELETAPEEVLPPGAEKNPFYHPELIGNYAAEISGVPPFISESKKAIAQEAMALARQPHVPYKGERIAPLSAEQKVARERLTKNIESNAHKGSFETAKGILSKLTENEITNATEAERKLAKAGISREDIAEIFDPYTESVINDASERMDRNYKENVEAPLIAKLTAAGANRGGYKEEMLARARRDFEEMKNSEINKLKREGHLTSLHYADEKKRRHLADAQLKAETKARDVTNTMDVAKNIHKLSQEENEQELKNIQQMEALGATSQDIAQKERNIAHENFLQQKAWPIDRLTHANSIINNLNLDVPIFRYQSPVAPAAQPNILTQLGGHALGLAGQLMSQKRAKGGRVYRADGGDISNPLSELQALQKAQRDRQLSQADEYEKGSVQPWGAWLSSLGSNIAASKNPNVMRAIGEAAPGATNAFYGALEANDQRKLQSVKLREAIAESAMREKESLLKHKYDREHFDLEKLKHESQAAVNKAHANLYNAQSKTSGSVNLKLSGPESKIYGDVLREGKAAPGLLKVVGRLKKYNKEAEELIGPEAGTYEDQTINRYNAVASKINAINPFKYKLKTFEKSLKARQLFDKNVQDLVLHLKRSLPATGQQARIIEELKKSFAENKKDPEANEVLLDRLEKDAKISLERSKALSKYRGKLEFGELSSLFAEYETEKEGLGNNVSFDDFLRRKITGEEIHHKSPSKSDAELARDILMQRGVTL